MPSYLGNYGDEKYDALSKIEKWFAAGKKVLNLLALPYSKVDIFLPIVSKIIDSGKRVLYISSSEAGYLDFVNLINKEELCKYYVFGKAKNVDYEDEKLVITSFDYAIKLEGRFDVVIYDEVTAYSNFSKYEIVDILARYYKNDCRIIIRSIESVLKNAAYIEMPARESGLPVVEPRFITTRLDLSKDMPYVMFEYIEWCTIRNKSMVIITPSKNISHMLFQRLSGLKGRVFKDVTEISNDYELKSRGKIVALSRKLIITNRLEVLGLEVDNMDFIVYDAGNNIFNYKKLAYICGKTCRNENMQSGEVVFISNSISDDMDTCKDLIRNFNKRAWELGFLSLLTGTPFIRFILRMFGVKIGRKTFMDTTDITEFDLVEIDEEAYINYSTLQTHLFEDRVMKMSKIKVKKNCNIGIGSFVLYDTVMNEGVSLGNQSLLMKGESLLQNTKWEGIPVKRKNIS